jgi:MFS superfamily sulfate permease-like transporter
MFHGLFLAASVLLLPWLVREIPLAALAAMLVYTGYRLASPKEWLGAYKIGREQLVIFTVTVVSVLATDLLVGIAVGIAVKFLIHWLQSAPAPMKSLVKPDLSIEVRADNSYLVKVRHTAVFSNWLFLKKQLVSLNGGHDVVLDLSDTSLVDHTVMEKLHELEKDFETKNQRLVVTGLQEHGSLSKHPHAARKKTLI